MFNFLKKRDENQGMIGQSVQRDGDFSASEWGAGLSKQNGEKYREIFENTYDAITYVDKYGKILDANKRAEEIFGYQRDELLGKPFYKLGVIETKNIPALMKLFKQTIENGQAQSSVELELKHKNGSQVFVEVNTAFIKEGNEVKKVVNVFRDITERKKTEEALKQSEEKYRKIFELSPETILVLDKKGVVVDINGRVKDLLGYEREEVVGNLLLQLPYLTAGSKARVIKNFAIRMLGKEVPPYELDFIGKDGRKLVGLIRAALIKDAKGEALGDIAIVSDITQLKETEKAMRASQEELQIILDSVPAWIFYKDKENRFVRVNQAFSKVMERTKEQLEGKSMFDFYPKEQADAYWRDDQEVISSGQAKLNIIEPMDSPKGTLWVQTHKIPYRDAQGQIIGVIGFTIDITETKRVEEEIKQNMIKLKRMNNLMVGRELEMTKLKKEIAQLQQAKNKE